MQLTAPVTDRGDAIGVIELTLPRHPDEGAIAAVAAIAHALAYVVMRGRPGVWGTACSGAEAGNSRSDDEPEAPPLEVSHTSRMRHSERRVVAGRKLASLNVGTAIRPPL